MERQDRKENFPASVLISSACHRLALHKEVGFLLSAVPRASLSAVTPAEISVAGLSEHGRMDERPHIQTFSFASSLSPRAKFQILDWREVPSG